MYDTHIVNLYRVLLCDVENKIVIIPHVDRDDGNQMALVSVLYWIIILPTPLIMTSYFPRNYNLQNNKKYTRCTQFICQVCTYYNGIGIAQYRKHRICYGTYFFFRFFIQKYYIFLHSSVRGTFPKTKCVEPPSPLTYVQFFSRGFYFI